MMALDLDDTIAAVATPAGPASRALVRVSGTRAWELALAGFAADRDEPLPARPEVRRGRLTVHGVQRTLPAEIALWPAPRTYTGQELAEIHTVGAAPLVEAVLADLLRRGARLAEPGEFTLRAFLNGRLDLTRAEAVLGVIDARTPAGLDAALQQLAGGLAGPIGQLRDRLLDVLAHLEAGLDFVDEDDVDPLGRAALADELADGSATILRLAAQLSDRDRPATRPRVVLLGLPNAGKSRLFNALVGSDRALVSPVAGTTRDYLAAPCSFEGVAAELIDTAGAEAAVGSITEQAQAHRAAQAESADLLLICRPADSLDEPPFEPPGRSVLHVLTKCDLAPAPAGALATSAATGAGLDQLRRAVAEALRNQATEGDPLAGTGARCRDSLVRAGEALRAASETLSLGGGDELVALDLHLALDELGRVVGAVVTDDILDRIFRRFCIGK